MKKPRTNLKSKYGITPKILDQMYADQDYSCYICKVPEHLSKNRLSIDHNHITNKVRGLLCSRCNFAIGILKTDEGPQLLYNAIDYVLRNEPNPTRYDYGYIEPDIEESVIRVASTGRGKVWSKKI